METVGKDIQKDWIHSSSAGARVDAKILIADALCFLLELKIWTPL